MLTSRRSHLGSVNVLLVGEWDLAIVGPHYAAVLVARDLGDDRVRRFEFSFPTIVS
jgi:DICT domain-containing protein